MNTPSMRTQAIWWTTLLAVVVFVVDLQLELDLADGALYFAVVVISLWRSSHRFTIFAAIACTALTVAGFFLSPAGGEPWKGFANRSVSLVAIWIAAILGMRALNLLLSARRLRDKASEMESIFQAFPDLGFRLDQHGTILSYYADSKALLYVPPEQFVGKRMQDVLPPDVGARFEEALREITRDGRMRHFEYRLRIGGEDRHWESRLLPLPGEDVFAIVRELTHQKNLEKEVLQAAHREHMAIGQELHDGVGQEVRGLGYLAKSLAQRLQRREADEAGDASRLADGMQDVLEELRAIARGLIPVEVNTEGLMVALEGLLTTAQQRYGCTSRFVCPRPVPVDDDHVALHLFRIAQEALSNSVHHANANLITIRLEVIAGKLVLEIRDDGSGLGEISGEDHGLGLRTMRYRAALIGAGYSAGPGPDGGTIVRCSLDVGTPGETEQAVEPSRDPSC